MYTRIHAQKKHILCGQVDKRDTRSKKNNAQRLTWTKNPKKVEVCTCAHAHTLKEIRALEGLIGGNIWPCNTVQAGR